jgi:hypothetical protein
MKEKNISDMTHAGSTSYLNTLAIYQAMESFVKQ